MSAALRLVERIDDYDDIHEHVELFAAMLLAPVYGRTVSMGRDQIHGRIVTASRSNMMPDG